MFLVLYHVLHRRGTFAKSVSIFELLGPKYNKNRFDKIGTRGQKSCCFDFLKVGYELFRSLLGIVFSLKRPTFSYIFNAKGLCMTSNIKILSLTFALCVGHFDHFRGKKQIFWDFWGLFWSCLEVVKALFLASSCQIFTWILSSKGCYITLKIKKFRSFFGSLRRSFW